MNSQLEMMKKAIDDASQEKGIQWNKVTWYSWALAVVVFFFVIPAAAFYIGTEYGALRFERGQSPAIGQACTEEAKICPDGSSVGRTGPSCEFAACRVVSETKVIPKNTAPVACTMDAKICPDGSSVGRVAPSCAFAACPSTTGRPEVRGTVMMGPMCTKIENKGQQSCKDQPYQKSLEIWKTDETYIKSIAVSIYGTFQTELTPGTYVLRLPKNSVLYPRIVKETPFTVVQGRTTELPLLVLDTGIR